MSRQNLVLKKFDALLQNRYGTFTIDKQHIQIHFTPVKIVYGIYIRYIYTVYIYIYMKQHFHLKGMLVGLRAVFNLVSVLGFFRKNTTNDNF